jgi:hypothetical protein
MHAIDIDLDHAQNAIKIVPPYSQILIFDIDLDFLN